MAQGRPRLVPESVRYSPLRMFVSDLRHFLDMPDDAPGLAQEMAKRSGTSCAQPLPLRPECPG